MFIADRPESGPQAAQPADAQWDPTVRVLGEPRGQGACGVRCRTLDRAIGTAAGADGSAGLRRESSSPARGRFDKLAWLAPVSVVSAPPDRASLVLLRSWTATTGSAAWMGGWRAAPKLTVQPRVP